MLHQTQLRTRSKVRLQLRALLGAMTELCLHGLDGVPDCHRLACDRVASKRMVAEWSKPERLLDGDHRAFVAVDVTRKGPVLAAQELKTGPFLPDMPAPVVETLVTGCRIGPPLL